MTYQRVRWEALAYTDSFGDHGYTGFIGTLMETSTVPIAHNLTQLWITYMHGPNVRSVIISEIFGTGTSNVVQCYG